MMDNAQTEQRRHQPWCGDDVDVLSWGATAPWTMRRVEICWPPWLTPEFTIILAEEGLLGLIQLYIGYCRKTNHTPK
jgi:hypothetical protein